MAIAKELNEFSYDFIFAIPTKICHANYIIPRSTVLLEKPIASQLLKTFPAFFTYLRFITIFTRARQLSLSWITPFQYTPHHFSWIYISILSSHTRPGVKSGLLPSSFSIKTPYTLLYPMRPTCPAHLILLNLIARLNMWNANHEPPHYEVFSNPLLLLPSYTQISSSASNFPKPSAYFSPLVWHAKFYTNINNK
jgi:hypothetical protein